MLTRKQAVAVSLAILLCGIVGLVIPEAASAACHPGSTLTVTNHTCSVLRVWVDGRPQGCLASGTFGVTWNIPTGWHVVAVTGCCGPSARRFWVGPGFRHRYETFTCHHWCR